MRNPIVVLGAGPAGLGVGLSLGEHALVLEGAADLGGLCRTVQFGGAVFDLGGHSFHTPHPEVRELVFRALAMHEQPRNAWCFVSNEWIPYPFQKHCEKLKDLAMREKCRQGLAERDRTRFPCNFGDYVDCRFGAGIAQYFLRPYNEKLWGKKLERLGVDWCRERIAAGTAEQFVATGGNRTPLQDDTLVAYPATGGFGEIFLALARKLSKVSLGQTVVNIDPLRRELVTGRGQVYPWRQLVSTLPLPSLLQLLPDVPSDLTEAAASLEALTMALVMVVVGHPVATPIQRVYCPGPEIPAHKIVINHNSSPYLQSLPHHGILAEVSNPSPWSNVELIEQVLSGLEAMGLIRERGVVLQTQVIRLNAAYPVPTLHRAAIVQRVKDWLNERGIHTIGRFGEWDYINSDEALFRGLRLGRQLLAADGTAGDGVR